MTTDTELRDLLTAEAGGPARGNGEWDEVVRRGRHRQRVRRAQGVALVVILAGLAAGVLALTSDDARVDTGPPATEGEPTTPEGVLHGDAVEIYAARAQGTSLKLFFTGVLACRDVRPLIIESEEEIRVGLVGEQDERGVPWASCGTERWSAVIDLRDPAGDRAVVDLSTEERRPVADSADLLFPTALPAPFDLDAVEETQGVDHDFWIFMFRADDPQFVRLSQSRDLESNGTDCDHGQVVEVRGTEGCFAKDVPSNLSWDEGGWSRSISLVSFNYGESALDELLAIAEGLEPLDG